MDSFKILVDGFLFEKAEFGLILISAVCILLIVIAVALTNRCIKREAENDTSTAMDNGKMLNSDNID